MIVEERFDLIKPYSHDDLRFKALKTCRDGGLQRRLRQDSRITVAILEMMARRAELWTTVDSGSKAGQDSRAR